MRSLRRDCKGQFVIIVALLISVLTLSLAFSVNQVNFHKQELRYQPVNELLLGVTSDMERALSKALSVYTYTLLGGPSNETVASELGTEYMLTWKKAVLTSYSTLDLRLTHDYLRFGSNWNGPVGFSIASTEYNLDVNGYGFKGWTGRAAKFVRLKFIPDSIDVTGPSQTRLEFQLTESAVNQNEMIPISNLSPELVFVNSLPLGSSHLVPVSSLTYLGNGMYTAITREKINSNTRGVMLTVTTPDDGIWVQTNFYQPIYLTLNTREENGTSTNLGQIRLRDKTYPSDGAFGTEITVDPTFDSVPYYLEFIPDANYSFVRWETGPTSNVRVQDSLSSITGVIIEGSGFITAVYVTGNGTTVSQEYCNILLDSREWNYTYFNDGRIGLNSTFYNLPQNVTGALTGYYQLEYVPRNASYGFYGWQFEGNISLVGLYAQHTTVRVYGDANITALYTFALGIVTPPSPPPPPPLPPWGDWKSLYFDDKRTLVPGYMWSGHDGHDETHSSQGNMKQTTVLKTPIETPNITCAQLINFTTFITPVPPESVKSLDFVFGFTFDGQYYNIGGFRFEPINATTTMYQAQIDIDNTTWVQGYGSRVIPEGSTLRLEATITFLKKNGFNFVYHGIDNPSRIDLF